MNLSQYSVCDGVGLAELVRQKEVTPKELKMVALEGIAKVNPQLNAIVSILSEKADEQIEVGLPDGPFRGVPFLIKEIILHAEGVPFSMGSRLAKGAVFPYDTELMARFRKAGLVTVGTTTTPEFGYNATTESVLHGPTHNPWNLRHSPGGSSGGSGAAVAAGVVPFAHANDGGGSIRIPASCNGLVGLKPTRGRVPTGPDYSEPLNGLGIEFAVTRTVRDAAALLDAVAGPDTGCYAWAEPPKRPFFDEITQPPRRLRIAWTSKPPSGASVDQECLDSLHATVRLCEELGHELVEASPIIDSEQHMLATLRIWAANVTSWVDGIAQATGQTPSEANVEAANLSTYRYGRTITATELLEALATQNIVSRAVGSFFTEYDVLLSPTTARPPLPLEELNANAKGLSAKEWTEQIFTYAPFTNLFNTTGQPAISLPLGWSKGGLPIGMQFAGRYADEATLLQLASQLEYACPWKERRPAFHVAAEQLPVF